MFRSHILDTHLNYTWIFRIRCSEYGSKIQIMRKYDTSMRLGILKNLLIGCICQTMCGDMQNMSNEIQKMF